MFPARPVLISKSMVLLSVVAVAVVAMAIAIVAATEIWKCAKYMYNVLCE